MLTVNARHTTDASYYLGPASAVASKIVGRWMGGEAGGLGMKGPVVRSAFQAVLVGRHPENYRVLRDEMRVGVSSYDLAFSTPKEVSVAFAIGPVEVKRAISAAHDEAVDASYQYVSSRVAAARRNSEGERTLVPVAGLLAGGFRHLATRSLDPHLHTHVVVANLGHGADGRWTTLDGRGFFAHARAAGSLYEAHLRHELSRVLGVAWQRRDDGRITLVGIGPELAGLFSGRSAEIKEHLWERSLHSRQANHVAWAATREPKDFSIGDDDLFLRWQHKAAAFGLDDPSLQKVIGQEMSHDAHLDERIFASRLLSRGSGEVTRRAVVAAWSEARLGGGSVQDVDAAADVWAHDDHLGVTERRLSGASVVPDSHHLALLGSRPGGVDGQMTWRRAAMAIDSYRDRWKVEHVTSVLETDDLSKSGASISARRLADHLALTRLLAGARQQLGRRGAPALDPPEVSLDRYLLR